MRFGTIAIAAFLIAACATEAGDEQPSTSPDTTTGEGTTSSGPSTTAHGAIPPVVGGVPEEKLEPLASGAAQQGGVPVDDVEVIRVQQVVWSSTALDCPEPGMFYSPALTNGYWVVLRAGGTEFDFRATIDGEFRRCVDGGPPYDVLVDR